MGNTTEKVREMRGPKNNCCDFHTTCLGEFKKIMFSLFRETHDALKTHTHIFAKNESRFTSNFKENIAKRSLAVNPS